LKPTACSFERTRRSRAARLPGPTNAKTRGQDANLRHMPRVARSWGSTWEERPYKLKFGQPRRNNPVLTQIRTKVEITSTIMASRRADSLNLNELEITHMESERKRSLEGFGQQDAPSPCSDAISSGGTARPARFPLSGDDFVKLMDQGQVSSAATPIQCILICGQRVQSSLGQAASSNTPARRCNAIKAEI